MPSQRISLTSLARAHTWSNDQNEVTEFRPFEEEYVLPLRDLLWAVKESDRDSDLRNGIWFLLMLILFLVVALLAQPVSAMQETQRAIMEVLVNEPFRPKGHGPMGFTGIGNFEEFWSWADQVLYHQLFNSSKYSGVASGVSTSNAFVVARYNQLVNPVRFHKDLVESLPNFDRPSQNQGSVNVDLDLDKDRAGRTLASMIQARWTDEWTSRVVVHVNLYNSNYDLATAFQLSVEQLTGGAVVPHVATRSCPLSPYRGVRGALQAVMEVAMAIFCGCQCVAILMSIRKKGCGQILGFIWRWLEIICLLSIFIVLLSRLAYVSQDRGIFRLRHPTEFKDMYAACSPFAFVHVFAAIAAVCSCIHIFRYLRVWQRFGFIWDAIAHSQKAVLRFAVILFIIIFAFSFSGHWLFGARVQDFSTWPKTFSFLVQSMITGLVSKRGERMVQVDKVINDLSPIAPIWAISWVLVSKLVIVNTFISILVYSVMVVSNQEQYKEQVQGVQEFSSWSTYFKMKFLRFLRDPDIREPLEKAKYQVDAWSAQLANVDREVLHAVLQACVARGTADFEVGDAMLLFHGVHGPESYRRAIGWMSDVSKHTGVKLRRVCRKPSTSSLVLQLTDKVLKLEEEAMGLTLQLQTVAPLAPKMSAI